MTCLLGFEQGVDVFFFGVKGVGDVLAGRSGALRSRQGRRLRACWALELGVDVFFAGVKGVGDVLAVRGAGCSWRCVWRFGGCWVFSRIFRGFRAPPGRPGVERQFSEPSSTHTCECSRAPAQFHAQSLLT